MRKTMASIGLSVLLAMLFVSCDDGNLEYKKKLDVKTDPAPQLVFDRYEDVLFALRELLPRIELDEAMRKKAKAPIDRMLEVLP